MELATKAGQLLNCTEGAKPTKACWAPEVDVLSEPGVPTEGDRHSSLCSFVTNQ